MPTYDYLCESCGNRFDVWQKMSDDPITLCPNCAGHVHRVIHATGIVFKGSGFYSTDHRAAAVAAVAPAASEDGKSATTTEPATAANPPDAAKATNTTNTANTPASTSTASKAAS